MKFLKYILVLIPFGFYSNVNAQKNPSAHTLSSDLGVENGWGLWSARTGITSNGIFTWGGWTAPAAPYFTRLSSNDGADPCANVPGLPIHFPVQGMGDYSFRLEGYPAPDTSRAEQVACTFTVTPQDTNFNFSYAIILEDAGHAASDQAWVSLALYDAGGTLLPCGSFTYTAGPLVGFQTSSLSMSCSGGGSSTIYYKPWTNAEVDLTPYLGQQVTVEITNMNCAADTNHLARSYWDFSSRLEIPLTVCLTPTAQVCLCQDPSYTCYWLSGDTAKCITLDTTYLGDTIVQVMHENVSSGCAERTYYYQIMPEWMASGFSYSTNGTQVYFTDTSVYKGPTSVISWTWDLGDGSYGSTQNPTHIYPGPNSYTVCLLVTSSAGCTDTVCQILTIGTGGVMDNDFAASMNIFPNPSNGQVTIQSSLFKIQRIELYNLVGEMIFEKDVHSMTETIKVDETEGMYFIKLRTEAGTISKKMVISH
jgi:hypothetical protein